MFESRAVVERLQDPSQVRIRVVGLDTQGAAQSRLVWAPEGSLSNRPQHKLLTMQEALTEPTSDEWLYLQPWDAKAIYEALAETYGHTTGDYRTLRRDFEHERGRVDNLIRHLTRD